MIQNVLGNHLFSLIIMFKWISIILHSAKYYVIIIYCLHIMVLLGFYTVYYFEVAYRQHFYFRTGLRFHIGMTIWDNWINTIYYWWFRMLLLYSILVLDMHGLSNHRYEYWDIMHHSDRCYPSIAFNKYLLLTLHSVE